MLEKPISFKGICWPIDAATNASNKFVGYLMPAAKGIPMQKGMFVKPLLKKNYPNWTRRNLIELAITILKPIKHLHDCNVLIGDINPLNILIQSDKEIYIVDTDSFQIEDYSCPVGMVNYTAPEIQGENFEKFLRNRNHEHFAIATLLFMILLPGKSPFSHQGGGNPSKNIKSRHFPYPLGDKSTGKAPEGPWRFIWSNLPYKAKKAFYQCFAEDSRLSVIKWLDIFSSYQMALNKEHVSNELFPTTYKRVSKHAKEEYGAEDNYETITCSQCKISFSMQRERAKKMREYTNALLCRDCTLLKMEEKELKKSQGNNITCNACGNQFFFNLGEQHFFKEKGLAWPKRCEDCRKNGSKSTAETYALPRSPKANTLSQRPSRPREKKESIWNIIFGLFD